MKTLGKMVGMLVMVLLATAAFGAEGSGQGGGGKDSGCGDVFGDLIHIKRDPATGQPILQKRWIEYPQDIYDWGYCPIPVDADGEEIPFADLSCDPAFPEAVVEVDYFGRLNGGRTKERNNRMHFDEVISSIKASEIVRQDNTGRLRLGYDCAPNENGSIRCDTWSTIDSPMENLALYSRLMKYGHLQTDPNEENTWAHGDPAAGIQYHPALAAEDWVKFGGGLKHLLPGGASGDPADCFGEDFENGFNTACGGPDSLNNRDFVRAASFLAGAANKTGIVTVDLVQYLNRILKITQATNATVSTPDTLPALIRDCGEEPEVYEECDIVDATEGLPAPADERFVDFHRVRYVRESWHDRSLRAMVPAGNGSRLWQETGGIQLLDWLDFINGPAPEGNVPNVNGFVSAGSDTLRTIEFVHNYAVPEDLGWDFGRQGN